MYKSHVSQCNCQAGLTVTQELQGQEAALPVSPANETVKVVVGTEAIGLLEHQVTFTEYTVDLTRAG